MPEDSDVERITGAKPKDPPPRQSRTKPAITGPRSKDEGNIWDGLVRIQKVKWNTGKVRYRIDTWQQLHGSTYSWQPTRWCNWLLPAILFASLLHRKLRKERSTHGEPTSMKTIIS